MGLIPEVLCIGFVPFSSGGDEAKPLCVGHDTQRIPIQRPCVNMLHLANACNATSVFLEAILTSQ